MIYEVKVFIDDGWSRGYSTKKVLANSASRAGELTIEYWKKKDSHNLMDIVEVNELEMTEGVIC